MPAGDDRCPVCRARFRASECGRCGADLTPLFSLLAAAHRERERARAALSAGDPASAARHARRAQELAATPEGARLAALTACLSALDLEPTREP